MDGRVQPVKQYDNNKHDERSSEISDDKQRSRASSKCDYALGNFINSQQSK